jgi:hypothetical protein
MLVTLGPCARIPKEAGIPGGARPFVPAQSNHRCGIRRLISACLGIAVMLAATTIAIPQQPEPNGPVRAGQAPSLPPRQVQAQRFLARRGGASARPLSPRPALVATPQSTATTATWQPLGPTGVITQNYGLVTGRISALALDPSDATGNHLFVGTTGGGVWVAQNAATSNPANIRFVPLTDNLSALTSAADASLSIGALSVQPGGTGVILAGTGDPNDALDSYYGTGILRSADGGRTWALIQYAAGTNFSFLGEGFAGFAWSTVSPNLVVAAVSQAYEGVVVGALRGGRSYEGLYYSTDSGATWALAQITDLNGQDVQGPLDAFANPDGNAATSVVWNPIRHIFIAAVRYHGYYQSPDGAHWTRLASQPGAGFIAKPVSGEPCPTRPTSTGSPGCPIYRGTLAVNPLTGDTFAWTVDLVDQDQGIWQDTCAISAGVCTQAIKFGKQWKTDALETDSWLGSATIQNGTYNLALAAVPSGQDTILLAGANDLWKCSLAMGCTWRNTTNSTACMSAQVGEYQHAVEWNAADPLELFVGNDSGLWRSTDGIAEAGSVCSASDASHFQNLNGALGSLADIESMSDVGASPYTMLLGLGVNGTAGVKSTTGPTPNWPQILTGEGGPVAIDPANPASWYVNNGVGVSIHLCSQTAPCAPADFGSVPVVSNDDVNGDGFTMLWPAPFLVDPLDSSQLLIGTCRIWRGPASGAAWTAANAISPMFDGNRASPSCNGNALVRSIAAMPIEGGGEIVYAGTYGSWSSLGATVPGHVLSATMTANGTWSPWQDLTLNPVANDQRAMNGQAMDISAIYIDPHDSSGNTVYVTIEGVPNAINNVRMVYRSTDGGAHWYDIQSNLQPAAANSLVIDPKDANIAYVATDAGVYITHDVASCATVPMCWSVFGSGLPNAPVVALSAAPPSTSPNVLVAGTYGRGVWQIPLATADIQLTSAAIDQNPLDFGSEPQGSASEIAYITLTNMGAITLLPTLSSIGGDQEKDFTVASDGCKGQQINEGGSCRIGIVFTPGGQGSRTATLTISANVVGGSMSVTLSGNGTPPLSVTVTPPVINFDQAHDPPGPTQVGATSAPQQITLGNDGTADIPISSMATSGPFLIVSNACSNAIPGGTGGGSCQVKVAFAPTTDGPATGTLTVVDSIGRQSVQLTGTGARPTDTLSTTSLSFPPTVIGQKSDPQTITISNTGGVKLTTIQLQVSSQFLFKSDCTEVLAPNSTCSISVQFSPTAAGPQTGNLTIADILNPGQVVSLSGTGLRPPHLTVNPGSLAFPATPVLQTASLDLKLTNDGGASVTGVGFQISGEQASEFATGAACSGATIAPGANCTMQVIFSPVSSGGARASLNISAQNIDPLASVDLSGTGQSSTGLGVNPTQLFFPAQDLNKSSAAQAVTVSNAGGTPANGLSLTVSGPFSLSQNNCATSLASGATCTTGVIFTPQSRGTLTGVLKVAAANIAIPATVSLSGIGGSTGAVQITPSQVNFPMTGVGSTSSPTTVTIANSSAGVQLDDFKLSVSSGFKTANNTCGEWLKAGASCTVDVSFAPTTAGAQNGTLSLTSEELTASANVPLSGMGFDFQATASGASSQTVSSGQTASYQLSLANLSGSSATLSLQCGSVPSYAACVFSPSSTTVSANGTGSITLKITTSQTSSAARPSFGFWQSLPTFCVIVLLPIARRLRRRLLLPLLALAILFVSGLTACSSSGGGGGGGTPPSPVTHTTPAGTYSIPVTVSSTGVQHTVTLTLVVD